MRKCLKSGSYYSKAMQVISCIFLLKTNRVMLISLPCSVLLRNTKLYLKVITYVSLHISYTPASGPTTKTSCYLGNS